MIVPSVRASEICAMFFRPAKISLISCCFEVIIKSESVISLKPNSRIPRRIFNTNTYSESKNLNITFLLVSKVLSAFKFTGNDFIIDLIGIALS